MLLQVKPGHCAESIQLGIYTRSLSVFACVLLKELKLNWAQDSENKVENVYSAVLFSKNSVFLTANNKGHRRGYFVTMQRMWYCYFLIVQRKQWVLLISPSGPGSVFAGVPWQPPAVLVSCWKLGSHVLGTGPEVAQGREKASSFLGLPRAVLNLPLAAGGVSLGGEVWLFYPCFGGAQGLGCFGSQASHCLPTRCALSNTDGSPLLLILPQKQNNFLAIVFIILLQRDAL